MKKTNVIIYGSNGKMGKALLANIKATPYLELVGTIGSQDSIAPILPSADIVIDFTNETATLDLLEKARYSKKALVIGTTGLSKDSCTKIAVAAKEIPIVFTPNYSVGVNVLFWLTGKATKLLGNEYDSEIIEVHHRFKKDAPSGTALQLANIISETRDLAAHDIMTHGREGIIGERKPSEIGMHSVRVGDVAGDHTVIFGNLGERLELTYRASNREAFATGALKAASWLVANLNRPGLYNMQHVLGLQ